MLEFSLFSMYYYSLYIGVAVVQVVEQVTYQLEGWLYDPRLLQSECQMSLSEMLTCRYINKIRFN